MSDEVQRRFFEDCARRYDNRFLRSVWPRNQQLKADVIASELGDAVRSGPVVELGCGTGQIAELLLEAHPAAAYVGLDLSPSMLDIARTRTRRFGGRTEFREVSGASLPLEPGRYRAAFGVDVLHHVDDPIRVLRELREALEPGAPLVFLEGNPRFPITLLIALLRREERNLLKIGFRNLRRWLEAAGLEDVRVDYGPLYTPPGPRRVAPLLDRVDSAFTRTPVVRGLAIFFTAAGRAPGAEL